jgi:hypothetical protein
VLFLKNKHLSAQYLLRRRWRWPTMRVKFVTASGARSVSPAMEGLDLDLRWLLF